MLALPAREQAEQRWQAAVAVLLKAAEHMAGRSGLSQGDFGRALPRRLVQLPAPPSSRSSPARPDSILFPLLPVTWLSEHCRSRSICRSR